MFIKLELIFSLFITIVLIYFAYRVLTSKNKLAVYKPFLLTTFFTLLWWLGYMLYLWLPNREQNITIIVYIGFTGIIGAAASFLITALTHYKQDIKSAYWMIYLVPLLSWSILWTNFYHKLFVVKFAFKQKELLLGPYYIFHCLYSYSCLLVAFIVLIYSSWKKGKIFLKKFLLFLGMVFIFFTSLLMTFKFLNIVASSTLYTTVFSLLIYWRVMFKYDFLNNTPETMKKIADRFSDALVVVDEDLNISAYNKAFATYFLSGEEQYVSPKPLLVEVLKEKFRLPNEYNIFVGLILKSFTQKTKQQFEQYLPTMNKTFSIEVTPLVLGKSYLGAVILFKDITEYKNLLAEITNQNEALAVLNKRLQNHSGIVKELVLQRERSRLETELHNMLGYNLNVLLRLLEVTRYSIKEDPLKAYTAILDAEATIKEAIVSGSKIVQNAPLISIAKSKDQGVNTIFQCLQDMLEEFRKKTGMQIIYWCENDFSGVGQDILKVIYNICQEAMTNSLKHGKANMIVIILRKQAQSISLSIMDDGAGCGQITKSGIGLRGMEQMVKECHGNIEFISDIQDGFKIRVAIPVS